MERLLRYLGRIGGEAEMERLAEQDAGIERLRRGERVFFRTPGNLALYRMYEREETDYHNTFRLAERKAEAKGMTRGLAKGRAKGLAEGIASTARRMLARGVSAEQVVDFTGLSPDEVEALRSGQP